MRSTFFRFSTILVALALLQGCIVLHEDSPEHSRDRETTIGEELEDLQEAFEEGLLTQQEYDRLRRRILDL